MKKIRLTVAYDGTHYSGWQIQDNASTIEGCLTEALNDLVDRVAGGAARKNIKNNIINKDINNETQGYENRIIGASRTDAGVHAYGNIAVFDTRMPIAPEKISKALNVRLPEDIRVLKSEEVTDDFHPRYTESHKTYMYQILNSSMQIPILDRSTYHVSEKLDISLMKEAAEYIVGEHDFSAFCSAGAQVKSKVRTVEKLDIIKKNIDIPILYNTPDKFVVGARDSSHEWDVGAECNLIILEITGNGFLYNMVRIIAGTLIEVGMGRRSPWSVSQALVDHDRSEAGPTAPAKGLILKGIRYGDTAQ